MEPRIAALESGQKRIEDKLDTLVILTAELKGQLSAMPSAATFGDLKEKLGELAGRIDHLPSTAKIGGLIGIAAALTTIVTRWSELRAGLHF